MFLTFYFILFSDIHGNRYSDDRKSFEKAAPEIQHITILRETEVIHSISEEDYPFQDCTNTLESVEFEVSQLRDI